MKVALLINMPSPYRNPSFNTLFDVLRLDGIELKCFFDVGREGDRQWSAGLDSLEPPYEFVPGFSLAVSRRRKSLGYSDKRIVHVRGTLFSLIKYNPDVIISCEFGARTLQSLAYKFIFRKKTIG